MSINGEPQQSSLIANLSLDSDPDSTPADAIGLCDSETSKYEVFYENCLFNSYTLLNRT
jgi:hypothetical protein